MRYWVIEIVFDGYLLNVDKFMDIDIYQCVYGCKQRKCYEE